MVFRLREAIGGFKHLSFRWQRTLWRRPETYFFGNFVGVSIDRFSDFDGKPAVCNICGYALIRAQLENGWSVETCSAMPALPPLTSAAFKQWCKSLPSAKLPMTRV